MPDPIIIHVGNFREIPFSVLVGGSVDPSFPVEVGVTQPGNLTAVELEGEPRRLRVAGTSPTLGASVIVRANGEPFALDFKILPVEPPAVDVVFGEPGPEQPI